MFASKVLNSKSELLEQTSLTAIINASREVADRLDYLRSLEVLLFKHKESHTLVHGILNPCP